VAASAGRFAICLAWLSSFRVVGPVATLRASVSSFRPSSLRAARTVCRISRRPVGVSASLTARPIGDGTRPTLPTPCEAGTGSVEMAPSSLGPIVEEVTGSRSGWSRSLWWLLSALERARLSSSHAEPGSPTSRLGSTAARRVPLTVWRAGDLQVGQLLREAASLLDAGQRGVNVDPGSRAIAFRGLPRDAASTQM
jgi:hypothetical protein